MKVSVTGKQIDVGDALRSHVEQELDQAVSKYFAGAIEAHVVFSREGSTFRSDCDVNVGHGIKVQGRAQAGDIYAAFDGTAQRVAKQLRRFKRRLRDHHANQGAAESEAAQSYVLAAEPDEQEVPGEFQPVIVAETETQITEMSLGDAVMRLELEDAAAFMFRNAASSRLNVVYRRTDGHIGWIDPAREAEGPA